MKYDKKTDKFGSFSDNANVFGLNFASIEDCQNFWSEFESVLTKVKLPLSEFINSIILDCSNF